MDTFFRKVLYAIFSLYFRVSNDFERRRIKRDFRRLCDVPEQKRRAAAKIYIRGFADAYRRASVCRRPVRREADKAGSPGANCGAATHPCTFEDGDGGVQSR